MKRFGTIPQKIVSLPSWIWNRAAEVKFFGKSHGPRQSCLKIRGWMCYDSRLGFGFGIGFPTFSGIKSNLWNQLQWFFCALFNWACNMIFFCGSFNTESIPTMFPDPKIWNHITSTLGCKASPRLVWFKISGFGPHKQIQRKRSLYFEWLQEKKNICCLLNVLRAIGSMELP